MFTLVQEVILLKKDSKVSIQFHYEGISMVSGGLILWYAQCNSVYFNEMRLSIVVSDSISRGDDCSILF